MGAKINRIVGFSFIAAATSVIAYALFRRHELDNNYKISIGTVTEMTGPGARSGGDYGLNYIYEVDHQKYTGEITLDLCKNIKLREVRQRTLNKNFQVAYDAKHPVTGMIILSL